MNFTKKFTLAEVKLQKKVFQSFQLSFIKISGTIVNYWTIIKVYGNFGKL